MYVSYMLYAPPGRGSMEMRLVSLLSCPDNSLAGSVDFGEMYSGAEIHIMWTAA
jgi:hypothetical protein